MLRCGVEFVLPYCSLLYCRCLCGFPIARGSVGCINAVVLNGLWFGENIGCGFLKFIVR